MRGKESVVFFIFLFLVAMRIIYFSYKKFLPISQNNPSSFQYHFGSNRSKFLASKKKNSLRFHGLLKAYPFPFFSRKARPTGLRTFFISFLPPPSRTRGIFPGGFSPIPDSRDRCGGRGGTPICVRKTASRWVRERRRRRVVTVFISGLSGVVGDGTALSWRRALSVTLTGNFIPERRQWGIKFGSRLPDRIYWADGEEGLGEYAFSFAGSFISYPFCQNA